MTILLLSREEAVQKRIKELGTLLAGAYEVTNRETLPLNQKMASFIKRALSCLVREEIVRTVIKDGLVDMAPLHQEIDQLFADLGSLKSHWCFAKYDLNRLGRSQRCHAPS
ncbi:hypothetical protein NP233_g6944 [Leucocoprinus birnbaumii]|uniref:Uncharacterized protein n=1 Tax=Leucocoprinus birnbaumii TaxID=56174 RepID=A0AAD5YT86_9AGAR|nr:hypothetical protein NP233_g6944 [Leucocoprinus birnbaumii]